MLLPLETELSSVVVTYLHFNPAKSFFFLKHILQLKVLLQQCCKSLTIKKLFSPTKFRVVRNIVFKTSLRMLSNNINDYQT